MVEQESNDSDASNQGRFSKAFSKPIGALKPEFKSKAKAKAERIDESIREKENKTREVVSKTKFVAGQSREAIVKAKQKFKRKPKQKGIGRFRGGLASLKELPRRIRLRVLTTEFPELGKSLGKPILEPSFVPKRFFEDVSRTSQWMAAFFLPIVIIVTLSIVFAANEVVEDLLLNGGDLGNQLDIFKFVSTFISLSLFTLGAWGWFLWVKTGGFKLFATG